MSSGKNIRTRTNLKGSVISAKEDNFNFQDHVKIKYCHRCLNERETRECCRCNLKFCRDCVGLDTFGCYNVTCAFCAVVDQQIKNIIALHRRPGPNDPEDFRALFKSLSDLVSLVRTEMRNSVKEAKQAAHVKKSIMMGHCFLCKKKEKEVRTCGSCEGKACQACGENWNGLEFECMDCTTLKIIQEGIAESFNQLQDDLDGCTY